MSSIDTPQTPAIKVGQHWKECDPRFERTVEIIAIDEKQTIRPIQIRGLQSGRTAYADRKRFNGKRSGYKLVQDI